MNPSPDADVHHDRVAHSPFVDVAWDLECLPWPWEDGQVEQIIAIDVFEHLTGRPWWFWLDECWRVLRFHGRLVMRLPAWDNPLTYRDPMHRTPEGGVRAFHEETFHYWDPCREVWASFGRIYGLGDRYWHVEAVLRDAGDFRYILRKSGPHGPYLEMEMPSKEGDRS
jgi:hypothetical protein